MNIFLLFALACLACLVPLPAGAAEGEALSATWLPPLVVVAVAALGGAMVVRRLFRRQARDQHDLAIRLHLTDQALDAVPLPILRLDAAMRVLAANQCAQRTYNQHGSPIGQGLHDLLPELANHPEIAALSADGKGQGTADSAPARLEVDGLGVLTTIAVQDRSQMFWFGATPAGQEQKQDPCDIDAYAQKAASRMKSEFIANINHEVRTPLNAIIGYTEMLGKSQLAAKEQRFVAIIHKSSMALVSIFNDIMELSKIDSDRFRIMDTPVCLPSTIIDVEGLFKELAEEKGIRFTCRMAGHLPEYILFDGVRLKQILQNLVGNAVKFTSEGEVSLTIDGAPSKTRPGCLDMRFIVEDTGAGIPEESQREIIDLFSQQQETSRHFNGVGLGLTLCSRLMAMMGGRLELTSAKGKGTKFTLLFDDVQTTEPVVHAIHADSPPQQEQQRKLLVVDDVDLIKEFITDFFQDSPYQVLTANNSEAAVQAAREQRPDLIFMDLNLSGVDGREITRQLRSFPETASIPVVVMTGNILDEADYRPLFDDLLQKPFRLDRLQEVVDRYAPIAAEAEQPPPPSRASENGNDQFLALLASDAWDAELESLRQQAVFSGNLADAAALGSSMRQRGLDANQTLLLRVGEELLQYAHDPDIIGVDRILAKLSLMANRTVS